MALLAAGFLVAAGVETGVAYAAGNGQGNGTSGTAAATAPGQSGTAPGRSGAAPGSAGTAGPTNSTAGPTNSTAGPQNSAAQSHANTPRPGSTPAHTNTTDPVGTPMSAGATTNGNRGHIQIEGVPDCGATPCGNDNDPHVTCTLTVQWFGYPSGTNSTYLSIRGQEPSGIAPVLSDSFEFAGANSPNGSILDTERTYPLTSSQLNADGLVPQQIQGYHLRVEVAVNGNPAKTHVIWWKPCGSTPVPGAGAVTPDSTAMQDSAPLAADTPDSAGTPDTPDSPTAILPTAGTGALTDVAPTSTGLAFTGTDVALMLAAAAGLMALGFGVLTMSRRSRRVGA